MVLYKSKAHIKLYTELYTHCEWSQWDDGIPVSTGRVRNINYCE